MKATARASWSRSSRRSRTGRGSRCMVMRSRLPICRGCGVLLSSKRRGPRPRNTVAAPDHCRLMSQKEVKKNPDKAANGRCDPSFPTSRGDDGRFTRQSPGRRERQCGRGSCRVAGARHRVVRRRYAALRLTPGGRRTGRRRVRSSAWVRQLSHTVSRIPRRCRSRSDPPMRQGHCRWLFLGSQNNPLQSRTAPLRSFNRQPVSL